MRTRTLFVLMGIGLLLAGSVRAAEDPPKTAVASVNQFFALLKAGNFNEAARYFVAPPGVEAAEILEKVANDLKNGPKPVRLVGSKEEGDLAVVILKIPDKGKSGNVRFYHMPLAMLRKDGLWKMYPSSGPKKKKDEKKEVRPDDDNYGEPDIKLEGAAKEKMAVLWMWAVARCEELNKSETKSAKPSIPPDGDFKQTKEWKALNRLVGSWEDQMTVTVPERKQGRGSGKAAWILGARFLQTKSQSDLDNSEAVSLYTYDLNRRVVRAWWFSSLGFSAAFTGSWDEATSTFTFKVDDAGPGSSTVTFRLIDDNNREWKVITKDADGKVVYEMSGTSTRQKKPEEKQAPDGLAQPPNVDFKQTKEWKTLNRLVGSWEYLARVADTPFPYYREAVGDRSPGPRQRTLGIGASKPSSLPRRGLTKPLPSRFCPTASR